MKLLIYVFMFLLLSVTTEANEKEADNAYNKKNYDLAFQLYQKAANSGSPSAQFTLGLMYRDAQGTVKNLPEAIKWQKKAAQQNYRPSLNELGVIYLYGYGTQPDLQQALSYFQRCHDLDWPPCSEAMARIYIYGEGGMDKNIEKAKPYLLHGIEEGMKVSLYLMAQMYLRGIGYEQDEYKGLMLLIESSYSGFDKAKEEIKKLEKGLEMPLFKFLEEAYGHSIPLDEIRVCPSSFITRSHCTVSWND